MITFAFSSHYYAIIQVKVNFHRYKDYTLYKLLSKI